MRCTIDASVFVASARSDEPNYLISRKFLREARSVEVYCPTLALAECAAAIARQTGDSHLAGEMVSMIEDFSGINLVPLDLSLARRAAQIAVEHRPRGADAVYAAVADAYDADLISWDQEMLNRCPAAVETMTPTEWLEANRQISCCCREQICSEGCCSPEPRLAEGQALAKSSTVTAMMDNSDGLGLSLPDLAALSRVGFLVYEEKLPLAEGLAEMVGRERAVDILRIHELWTSIPAFICKARDMITARLMWTPDIAAPMTHKILIILKWLRE